MSKKIKNVLIALLLILTMNVSPLYAAGAGNSSDVQASTVSVADGFELVSENDTLKLYLNPDTLGIQVYDKNSRTFYNSFVDSTEGFNESWQNFMYSGISLEYMTDKMKLVRLSFANSGASADITSDDSGFEAKIAFKEGFSLTMKVTIKDNRLSVSVPDESIKEPEEGLTLQNIYVYPFLGATYGIGSPGYLFIPDGCGALIRTDVKCVSGSSSYSKRVYGQEYGTGDFRTLTERSMLSTSEIIYMPVYGVILEEGKSGIAAVIEDGDAYAAIEAAVSGSVLPANYVTAKFIYRETYTRSLNQSGDSMIANQPERNHLNILEHYYFLPEDSADYSGMARVYQDFLIQNGTLADRKDSGEKEVPFHLEILLSEKKQRMIGFKTIVMTTKEQTEQILSELYQAGIENMDVILMGYSSKGTGWALPTRASFSRKIATASEWKKVIEAWKEKNVDIGFYADFSTASTKGGGYSKLRDVAQNISEKLLQTFNYGICYYLAPFYVQSAFIEEAEDFMKTGTSLLALDSIGHRLYSNWNTRKASTRQEGMEIYENLSVEGLKTAFYAPSSYLWKNAEAIYDIPSGSSEYMIFTDTVPFMQMVLKGYVDYYGSLSNFHSDTQKDILKMIEYGEYPAWLLTYEDSVELIDTPSAWLYTSQYSMWKDQVLEEYQTISKALGDVRNAHIAEHSMLTKDVARVTYDNGVVMIINYGNTSYTYNNLTVEPLSYGISGER